MIDEQDRERWMKLKQQVLPFDFWEDEKKEAQLKAALKVDKLVFYENPKNDNQRLQNLQWRYKHGDGQALSEMYELCITVCMKFIHAIGRHNRHVKKLTWDEKQIKAADATSYFIEQYLKRPDFVADKNIPGYLYVRVEHELFYQRKVDQIVDFVDLNAFFKEGEEPTQENEDE